MYFIVEPQEDMSLTGCDFGGCTCQGGNTCTCQTGGNNCSCQTGNGGCTCVGNYCTCNSHAYCYFAV